MSAVIHIGLQDAGETEIKHWLSRAEGVALIARNNGDDEVTKALRELLHLHKYADPAPIRAAFGKVQSKGGQVVVSDDPMSSWKRYDPEEAGERAAEFFPKPRVIFVVRRPITWARARYVEQLWNFQRDTFTGINPWLEKHMSRLRVGSQIAPARFRATLERFRKGSGAQEALILPYEQLIGDRAGFISAVETFIGLPGALAAVDAEAPAPAGRDIPIELVSAYRMLGLRRREPEDFKAAMAVFNRFARKRDQATYESLLEQPLDAADWASWFRRVKAPLSRAIQDGDEELMQLLSRFEDYELRPGLAAYLNEIEAEETEGLLKEYGVDLRPWGYGAKG